MKRFMGAMAGVGVLGVCLSLAGCSASFDPQPTTGVSSMGEIQGVAYGGNQPIAGAEVFLLEANSTAYAGPGIAAVNGNASKSLLTSGDGSVSLNGVTSNYVLTAANGAFTLSGKYTCDSGQVVYAYSVGGNPGAGGVNSAAGLLAVLGKCPTSAPFNLSTVPFVWMNEVSTVAAAYSLAGFATDATHVGYSGSALGLLGIQNAAANAGNLVNVATGTAYTTGTPGSVTGNVGTVPYKTINTIANILAACLNSASSSSANCNTLFTNMESGGSSGSQATDTATEAIYFAHNSANVSTALFNLQAAAGAPFPSDLSGTPTDWSLAVFYTGGGINGAYMLAIDGSGNVWTDSQTNNSLNKFSPLGVAKSGTGFTGGGISTPTGIAVDPSGNVWVMNGGSSKLSEFSNAGSPVSASGYSPTGWAAGTGLAIDAVGDVWGATGGAVTKVHGSGGLIGTTSIPFSNVGPQGQGYWLALDPAGNLWTANGSTNVTKINATATTGTDYTLTGITNTEWVASDSTGNIWVCNGNGSNVDLISSTGTALVSVSGIGGVSKAFTVQVDGAGQAWLANSTSAGISGLTPSGTAISPSSGFLSPAGANQIAAAVDGSGNVWAVDIGNTVTQWIGIAAPLYTPMTPSKAATRP